MKQHRTRLQPAARSQQPEAINKLIIHTIPMFKRSLTLLLILAATHAPAQTLFTYGKYSVDKKEFLRAYEKNNTAQATNKAQAVKDYLQLYINSRLKIREAYVNGFDTLASIKNEVDNLRSQIVDNYMTDPTVTARLQKEAFQRSLTDLRISQIFIATSKGDRMLDTAAAQRKLDEVLQLLKQGRDFGEVARQYSDDGSSRATNGDMGYITVFNLPYEVENLVYKTPVGSYSAPLRSKAGFHIFKVTAQRKDPGRIKAQQILLAFPPGVDENYKKTVAAKADSIYKRLLAGDDFAKLAAQFSNDYISAANGGNLPDIGIGQFDPAFENVLFSLPKDGALSKPFMTSHGWHILKRVSLKPAVTDPNDKLNQQDLQQKITLDGRWKTSRDFIYNAVQARPGVRKYPYNPDLLWLFADSLLEYRNIGGQARTISTSTALLSIGDSMYRVSHFIAYAQAYRYKQDGSGMKPYTQVMDEFEKEMQFNYYREHLEAYNEEFSNQMNEFRDGNLFFEIMQREIWNKAQADSMALVELFEKNKPNYNWKPSADAVIYFCSDPSMAKTIWDLVKKNPADWRKINENYSEKVLADSSRYEYAQIPNLGKQIPKAGLMTQPLVNKNDNTASFAYIVKHYPQPAPRTFNEARGLVINDYQAILEANWIKALREKYPVVIDEAVLASILK